MKLLFDQNLSPRLVSALADCFPGASHVEQHQLGRAADALVWAFAIKHEYARPEKILELFPHPFRSLIVRYTPPAFTS